MDNAFKYTIDNGLCDESDYPYDMEKNDCKANLCVPKIKINKCFQESVTSLESIYFSSFKKKFEELEFYALLKYLAIDTPEKITKKVYSRSMYYSKTLNLFN